VFRVLSSAAPQVLARNCAMKRHLAIIPLAFPGEKFPAHSLNG
jgi:hypothetical protein